MVDSDESDNVETQMTGKRSREDDSGDEKLELPSKRPCSKSPETPDNVDSSKNIIVQVRNGSSKVLKEGTDDAVDDDNEQKNGEAIDKNDTKVESIKDDETLDENDDEKMIVEEKNLKPGKLEAVESETEEDGENVKLKNQPILDKSNDSEVVDGLELSVECASDKEASSSESDKEKDARPRPKTIIVKAKPNDSELEVGSSDAEKSDIDEKDEENDAKSKKLIGRRKKIVKKSSSHSGESSDSNSDDEDYSPNGNNKLKKTVTPKKASPRKGKGKTESGNKKKSVTESENEKSESEDEEMNLADRAKKVNKTSKSASNTESSDDDDDDASSKDSNDQKNGKSKNKKMDPKSHKTIKRLRKYLTTAGIQVHLEKLWVGCKTINQRADRMKELLTEKGIKGRPTLEKCKKLKKKLATKKEIAELDTSNIISEGRITRSRRIEAKRLKEESSPTQDAQTLFKRIQPVCDSDTE